MGKYYSGTISKGSSGNDVKEWQNFLKSQGYAITVDGIFGDDTERLTKEYQTANGLGSDGIVGVNTWSKAGYSDINTPTSAPTISAAPTNPTFNNTNYDKTEAGKADKTAMDTAINNFNNYGSHTWGNQGAYDTLLNEYLNRGDFSYDLNGDALYQQYKDKYIQQGKLAMQDTMGQASAMTGGYGSSYSQSVGQQAYQNSLDNLNDIVPELYQMAYDRYNQKGADMLNQLGVLNSDYNMSLGEWQTGYNTLKDKLGIASDTYYNNTSVYNTNRENENTLAQNDYENRFNAWDVGNQNAWEEAKWNEGIRQDALDRILDERQIAIAEEELALKKNSMEDSLIEKTSSTPTLGDGYTGPNDYYKVTIPSSGPMNATDSKDDYADWNYSDWNEYFYNIRTNQGKSAAETELNRMIKAGLIPTTMIQSAATAARGSSGH